MIVRDGNGLTWTVNQEGTGTALVRPGAGRWISHPELAALTPLAFEGLTPAGDGVWIRDRRSKC